MVFQFVDNIITYYKGNGFLAKLNFHFLINILSYFDLYFRFELLYYPRYCNLNKKYYIFFLIDVCDAIVIINNNLCSI